MIVSWNWLSQYVRLDMPVERLAERLALTGLNHESTEEVGGDLAIDLEVTSNRPDCLGHLGIAREVAVVFDRPLREPDPRPPATASRPVEALTSVAVEAPEVCPRFTARVVSGVTVKESPWWLRKRLETIGVRPISNIVDITNYVMFECGQPLHAYDLDALEGGRLVVRHARKGETLRAINGKVYELDATMLAIADAARPVGLAGVMGGLESEIGASTKNVLIEAAQFDVLSVRRTSRALGLFSPSSYRFERPLDPERTEWASRRTAELILELAGGELHPGVIDVGRPAPERNPIALRLDQLPRVLGIAVGEAEVVRILRALGLEHLGTDSGTLSFRPPSWRADLEREIDLVEEVARIHGYEHIPEDRPVPLTRSTRGPRERVEAAVRSLLAGAGLDEAYTFSLVGDELIDPIAAGPVAPPLRVDHASRRRENALRQSLVPGLLAARAYNEAHGVPDAALFEIAHVYLPRPDGQGALPEEPPRVGLVTGGDFGSVKGLVEALLDGLHVKGERGATPIATPLFEAGRAAALSLDGTYLGTLGEVAKDRRERHGLRGACAAAELDLNVLIERAALVPQYRPLPAFPAVERDLSLVLPVDLAWSDLAAEARGAGGAHLEALAFLDTFAGGDIPPGRHSLHFGLRFRNPERTLTGEEVDRAVRAIVEACAGRFGATLRA
jgi:phenylalanyl-tRNA synthetase beta chain